MRSAMGCLLWVQSLIIIPPCPNSFWYCVILLHIALRVWNISTSIHGITDIQLITFLKISANFITSQILYNVMDQMLSTNHAIKFCLFNTLRPRQDGHHFVDDIFKCIFLNENVWIPIKISLKFVPKGPINNSPAMVQIMAWHHPGHQPLYEPMVVSLPTHICVAGPQCVNTDTQ